MKITREEFKEYAGLYKDIWEKCKQYISNPIKENESILSFMRFYIGIIEEEFKNDKNIDFIKDIFHPLAIGKSIPINWINDNGNYIYFKCSDNLDEIYDKYLA